MSSLVVSQQQVMSDAAGVDEDPTVAAATTTSPVGQKRIAAHGRTKGSLRPGSTTKTPQVLRPALRR